MRESAAMREADHGGMRARNGARWSRAAGRRLRESWASPRRCRTCGLAKEQCTAHAAAGPGAGKRAHCRRARHPRPRGDPPIHGARLVVTPKDSE